MMPTAPAATGKPGERGNKAGGRKPGSVGAKTKFSNELHDELKAFVPLAKTSLQIHLENGNWRAVEFVLSRFLPVGRLVDLGSTDAMAYADALATGQITFDELNKAASGLKIVADTDAIAGLIVRLEELETLLLERRSV